VHSLWRNRIITTSDAYFWEGGSPWYAPITNLLITTPAAVIWDIFASASNADHWLLLAAPENVSHSIRSHPQIHLMTVNISPVVRSLAIACGASHAQVGPHMGPANIDGDDVVDVPGSSEELVANSAPLRLRPETEFPFSGRVGDFFHRAAAGVVLVPPAGLHDFMGFFGARIPVIPWILRSACITKHDARDSAPLWDLLAALFT
jgi:hypothetical protein